MRLSKKKNPNEPAQISKGQKAPSHHTPHRKESVLPESSVKQLYKLELISSSCSGLHLCVLLLRKLGYSSGTVKVDAR